MRLLVVCLLAVGGLSATARADAFCRTTTSAVPSDYDPSANGCWLQGTPLAWSTTRVPYGVATAASRQVSLADATRIADLAFAAWTSAACAGVAPNIQPFDDGPIATIPDGGDCSQSGDCDAAARDVLFFDDDTWPHNDPTNSLALTTVTYGIDDGRIFEAYTEINSAGHQLTVDEPPPADGSAYDLQAILTHEAGHFLGLAHAAADTSIMYAFYKPGAVTLSPDDVQGICAIYPQSAPKGGGCACAAAPSSTIAGGAGIGGVLLSLSLSRRRRRLRPSKR